MQPVVNLGRRDKTLPGAPELAWSVLRPEPGVMARDECSVTDAQSGARLARRTHGASEWRGRAERRSCMRGGAGGKRRSVTAGMWAVIRIMAGFTQLPWIAGSWCSSTPGPRRWLPACVAVPAVYRWAGAAHEGY